MANSVYTYVTVEFVTEEQATQFLNTIHPGGSLDSIISEHIFPGLENTREAWIDTVGAKWCFVHDVDTYSTTVTMQLESAWSFPEDLILAITAIARKTPGFRTLLANYEDEGLCFIGAFGATQTDIRDDEETWEDLRSMFCEVNGLDAENDDLEVTAEPHGDEFREFVDGRIEALREYVETDLTEE